MALIDLQNINKQYDTKIILKDINLTINPNQKIAIIGQNGQGKSTLLKIITKEIDPDSGDISIDKSINIQMLEQQPKFPPNITVKEAIQDQLVELNKAKKQYDKLTLELEKDFNNKQLLQQQADLATYLDFHNAWDLDISIQKVLLKFKLKEYENKLVSLLSGGEQRRVLLAGLLLKKPDILLLDEPTNHLDVYMVEYLEQMILKSNFTLIFISHDRYFIDNIATNILEIQDGKLYKYSGGYSDYLKQKQELLQNMQKDHHNLLKLLKAEASWMQKGVTARRKRNIRRKDAYFALKDRVKKNPAQINKIKLQLQREQKSFNQGEILNKKKMLFELDNIEKSLGDKLLIKDFTTRILQKDTIAIVGANGSGKSTLINIFLGKLKVDKGRFKKGDFKVGYFDQQRDMLNDDKTIIETFCPNGGDRVYLQDGRNMHVFGYLKNFLFPKEYLDKKIGILSGGEKNRVALALLFTKDVDCLILDEPTNDLDIPTINILEDYLINFQGALIFVSHDRYFVDKIAKKLFIFEKNAQIIQSYQSYSQYLQIQKELDDLNTLELELKKTNPKKQIQKKQTKLSYKEQNLYDNLQIEIENLEKTIQEIEQCLYDTKCYENKSLVELSKQLEVAKKDYEEKINQYLELEELLEKFKKDKE